MNTNTHKHFQWALESGAALIIIGAVLNFLVMRTLGSFDAAAVILALFVGFWAFVLGNVVLTLTSIWLFIRQRHTASEPMSGKPAETRAPIGLPSAGHSRMCHC
jgi:hypothetical protein